MRQKDAETVATILGNNLRTCTDGEQQGLRTALLAVEGHMVHVHPEFDPVPFWAAAAKAAGDDVKTWDGIVDPGPWDL